MSGSGSGLKWSLVGVGVLLMLLKVVILLRFDQSRKNTGHSGENS